ncbi:MAG: hypothetical protein RBS34_14550, partial [Desulfofustis sp.]|nr:hypothetical protein [Desulfofustis sp.]
MRDAADTRGFRIIVTDSNSRVRDLLKRELERDGYSVSSLRNGQEILERMVHPESVDLIILDPELFCPYSQRVF